MSSKSLDTMTLAVIGCGRLGSALVRGFSRDGGPREIRVCDPNQEKLDAIRKSCDVFVTQEVSEAVQASDIVLIAVKPKAIPALLGDISLALAAEQSLPLIISVAAGVPLSVFSEALPAEIPCARAMPNAASRIAKGLSGVFCVSDSHYHTVEQLFSLVGLVSRVANETLLDAITGASASGQAFVCLVIEALADGAAGLGISEEEALQIAAQTVLGAAALVLEEGSKPAAIRAAIATPGGTTEAGLKVLGEAEVEKAFVSAVKAATDKAIEIRGGSS